jgi:hypothetical protein
MKTTSSGFRSWRVLLPALWIASAFWQGEMHSASAQEAISNPSGSVVRGRVSGHDEKGAYLGTVPGATIEFSTADGFPAGQARTDGTGYYEIANLVPGTYRYKVTAESFAADDAGRGFLLPDAVDGFLLDFILVRGNGIPPRSGSLSGQVQMQNGGQNTPMAGVKISAKRSGGRDFATTFTDPGGAYSLDLPAGEWQVSAVNLGMEPQVNPGTLTVGGTTPAKVDFVFTDSNFTIATTTKDVFAQVNVPAEVGERVPQVRFVSIASGEAKPGTVSRITDAELQRRGVTGFFSKDNPVIWYEAQPSEPLPPGNYLAEAEMEGLPVVISSEKSVTSDQETWFDLSIAAATPEIEIKPTLPGVRGRVSGQNELGEYLGIVAGATIELVSENGASAATATTDETGFYEIPVLGAGTWGYRVTSPDFAPDDAGRGFVIAEESGVQILDFILSRTNPAPARKGKIRGHVWKEMGGEKFPISGALITLKQEAGKTLTTLTTNSSGEFESELAPAMWMASALSDDFQVDVHPAPVELLADGEATIDFTFSGTTEEKITRINEVYAVVSVELTEGAASPPAPEIAFVTEGGETSVIGTVRQLRGRDLEILGGISVASSTNLNWYESTPTEYLPAGLWRVTGVLDSYEPVGSEAKSVGTGSSTYFDLNLSSAKNGEPDPDPVPVIGTVNDSLTRVMGRVSGQTDRGDYEGVLQGARVDIFSGGALVASTQTDSSGFYEIDQLRAGEYQYRVLREPYDAINDYPGFRLPKDNEGYVLDFILTRPVAKSGSGELSGHVWADKGELKTPARNAQVAVMNQATGEISSTRSRGDGSYEFFLEAGQWRVSATADRLGSQDYPQLVSVSDGGKESVDFTFSGADPMPPLALPVQLTGTVSVSDSDGKFPEPGATVAALNQASGAMAVVQTDENGAYQFQLTAGEYRVGSSIEELGDRNHPELVALAEGASKKINFVFEVEPAPKSGQIAGHVRLKGGDEDVPLPGVRVTVMNSMGERDEVLTDEEGNYEFVLSADSWRIAASSGQIGSHVHPDPVTLEAGGTQSIDFVIPELPVPDLSPVYVMVAIERQGNEVGGNPMIELLKMAGEDKDPALVDLTIEALGANPGSSPVFQKFGMGGAMREGDWQYFLASPVKGGVSPGLYAARSALERYVPAEAEPRSANAGLETVFELFLKRVRPEILVQVESSEGTPIPEASVTLVNQNLGQSLADAPRIVTNGEGVASEILDGGFGSYNVMINREGYQSLVQEVSVEEATTTLKVKLLEWPEVLVTVNDSKGTPIPGVDLKFINRTRGQGLNDAEQIATGERGTGSMVLKDGFADYAFTASKSGYQMHAQELKVEEELVSLSVRLFKSDEKKIIDLTGVVVENPMALRSSKTSPTQEVAGTLADGKRVPNAKIAFQVSPGMTLPASLSIPLTTNGQGEFSAQEVTEGTYQVAVAAEGYEPHTGTITVAFGTDKPILALDPRAMELENWIRMILTQGWGKPSASQFHQNGVKADPGDGKVDYALGLSSLRGEDRSGALSAYSAAAGKVQDDIWWDRSCEGYIWSLMYYDQAQNAASEIGRLITNSYAIRAATPESRQTAYMFGVAVGVLNGPWNSEATKQIYADLDRNSIAALQEPLRSSYVEGRNSVFNQYNNLSSAENDAKQKVMQEAAAEKARIEATTGVRMREIEGLLGNHDAQKIAINNQWQTYVGTSQVKANQYTNEINRVRQNLAVIQAQLGGLQQQPQAPMQRMACAVHREEGGFNPNCPECAAATQAFAAQNQGNQGNSLGMQGQALILGRQLATLQGEENQLIQLINGLNAEYSRAELEYRRQIGELDTMAGRLRSEYSTLTGKMQEVPDINAEIAKEGKKFEASKKSFITYSKYPIELRRQELLDWVNRKSELPDLNNLQLPPVQNQNGEASPQAFPPLLPR